MGRTTSVEWERMRKDYEDGLYGLSELAELNSISISAVKKTASKEHWKRPETDRTIRKLKTHRVLMLEAICSSTMEGLKKADDLLAECDSLRDVELHSKTVKNYRDICVGKPEDVLESAGRASGTLISELQEELMNMSEDDIRSVLES